MLPQLEKWLPPPGKNPGGAYSSERLRKNKRTHTPAAQHGLPDKHNILRVARDTKENQVHAVA
jgi:hypothetical protein